MSHFEVRDISGPPSAALFCFRGFSLQGLAIPASVPTAALLAKPLLAGKRRKLKSQTEAEVDEAVGRRVEEAIRYTAEPRKAVPATATVHTNRARRWTSRVRLRRRCVWFIPVLTPLTHIA